MKLKNFSDLLKTLDELEEPPIYIKNAMFWLLFKVFKT